jgi:hypothetical protein
MKTFTGIFCIILALALVSCSGSDSTTKVKIKKGEYSYILTDSANTTLVEGILKIDAVTKMKDVGQDMYSVTGSYTIDKMTDDTAYVGFSSMRAGDYKGFYNLLTNSVNINTNPQIADANVFINADVKSGSIEGSWSFSTFRGSSKEGGFFKAIKKK